jgi:hypothetical protein
VKERGIWAGPAPRVAARHIGALRGAGPFRRWAKACETLAALGALAMGCERAPALSSGPAPVAPSAAPASRVAPAPTSLAHCLEAPFAPSATQAPKLGALAHHACEARHASHVLALGTPGTPPPDEPALGQLAEKLRSALEGVPVFSTGFGLCCSGAALPGGLLPERCVTISLALCARPLAELGQVFESLVSELQLQNESVGLEVSYWGNTGPRCQAQAADCLPSGYLSAPSRRIAEGAFALPYDPTLPRRVVTNHSGARSLGGACQHDGECALIGNGVCGAWYLPHAPGGSHVEHIQMYDDYCGCVQNECAWFTPERPEIVLQATFDVSGWGEPPVIDPERFDVGYGTGEQVVQNELEGRWMRRQLQRCYLQHPGKLPETLSFALEVDKRGKVTRGRVSGAGEGVRECVDQVFGWLRFPAPHARGGRHASVRVTGSLLVGLQR